MRQHAFNVLLFVLLAGVVTVGWWQAQKFLPNKQDQGKKPEEEIAAKLQKQRDEEEARNKAKPPPAAKPSPEAVAAAAGGPLAVVPPKAPPPTPAPPPPPPVVKAPPPTLIRLGGPKYFNRVLLSDRGGGVQQVVVPMFNEADRVGKERKYPDGTPVPLHLIPGIYQPAGKYLKDNPPIPEIGPGPAPDPQGAFTPDSQRLVEPSYTLFHYPSPDDKFPDPDLGERPWKLVKHETPDGGVHTAVYETELGEPYWMRIRKTYTLGPKDYHVGMQVEFERLPQGAKGKGQLRVQYAGPHGLPIEGEWYTSTYRAAMIGWADKKGTIRRSYEESSGIGLKRGGDKFPGGENNLKYAAVFTQFFTSALAVDDTAEGPAKAPWSYCRATTELPFRIQQDPNKPYFDDITVRAVTEPLDLAPGDRLTQKYLIYNGPSKVRLLGLLKDGNGVERAVDKDLVDRYLDRLGLRTLTDYRSPTWLGAFADSIYWTDLVIACTNLMHGLLALIHAAGPSWGVSIIVLTVMVRLLLLIPSKKQTAMNVRMTEMQKRLKPELDKLHEKYKDDFHRYNQEKTRLMMQHGVNPFAMMGGCLLLFAQMPIMMGLYFGLQESIFFRLEPFFWVQNLAAPDMLVWWSEKIPYVSTPDSIGNFYYLGPYLNILPLLAVGLMLWQQHKMMPPPTDEQMAQQQKMMKWMMVVMAVMFYKVAAGLALYFIISTGWGLVERRLVKKPGPGDDLGDPAKLKDASPNGAPAAPPKPRGPLGRFKERLREKMEELQRQAEEQSSRQLRNDRDPNRPAPIRNPERRDKDKKKKRRK